MSASKKGVKHASITTSKGEVYVLEVDAERRRKFTKDGRRIGKHDVHYTIVLDLEDEIDKQRKAVKKTPAKKTTVKKTAVKKPPPGKKTPVKKTIKGLPVTTYAHVSKGKNVFFFKGNRIVSIDQVPIFVVADIEKKTGKRVTEQANGNYVLVAKEKKKKSTTEKTETYAHVSKGKNVFFIRGDQIVSLSKVPLRVLADVEKKNSARVVKQANGNYVLVPLVDKKIEATAKKIVAAAKKIMAPPAAAKTASKVADAAKAIVTLAKSAPAKTVQTVAQTISKAAKVVAQDPKTSKTVKADAKKIDAAAKKLVKEVKEKRGLAVSKKYERGNIFYKVAELKDYLTKRQFKSRYGYDPTEDDPKAESPRRGPSPIRKPKADERDQVKNVRVMSITGGKKKRQVKEYQVLNPDTGKKEWVDRSEFVSTFGYSPDSEAFEIEENREAKKSDTKLKATESKVKEAVKAEIKASKKKKQEKEDEEGEEEDEDYVPGMDEDDYSGESGDETETDEDE